MKLNQARAVLASLPAGSRRLLSAAHDRYMYFAGVYTDQQGAQLAARDRAEFAQLLRFTPEGHPSLSDERCVAFMAAVSGLPAPWCSAWEAMLFAGASIGVEEGGDVASVVAAQAGQ